MSVWWTDDVWWDIIMYTFLSEPSVSLTHVDCNQQGTIWYTEPVDKCQIKANLEETSLFWFFTNQMYCTFILLLAAPVLFWFFSDEFLKQSCSENIGKLARNCLWWNSFFKHLKTFICMIFWNLLLRRRLLRMFKMCFRRANFKHPYWMVYCF